MRDHLTGLVADLDIPAIREGVVRILAEVWMKVSDEAVQKRLAGAGLEVRKGRVFIGAERRRSFMDRRRAAASPERDDLPIQLHTGSHTLYHFDPEDRKVKLLTVEALERYTRLVAALHRDGRLASAFCVGTPADVPPQMALLWQQFIGARFIPDPPVYVYSAEHVPFLTEMAKPHDELGTAWKAAREAIDGYDYELDEERRRALDAVLRDAQKHLCK